MLKNLFLIFILVSSFLSAQSFDIPHHYPYQNAADNYDGRSQFISSGSTLYVIYNEYQSILMRTSSDGGINWSAAAQVAFVPFSDYSQYINMAAVITQTGRMLLLYTVAGAGTTPTKVIYSDNQGSSWSSPVNLIGSLFVEYPSVSVTPGNVILAAGGTTNHFFKSTDNGVSWTAQSTSFRIKSIAATDNNNYFAFSITNQNLTGRKSTDAGATWTTEISIANELNEIDYAASTVYPQNKINLLYSVKQTTPFTGVYQKDLFLMSTTDNGTTWTSPLQITKYKGDDAAGNFYSYDNNLYINFISDRWSGYYQTYGFKVGVTSDDNSPPVVVSSDVFTRETQLVFKAMVDGYYPVTDVKLIYTLNDITTDSLLLYDDGLHEDGLSGDQVWGGISSNYEYGDQIIYRFSVTDSAGTYVTTGFDKIAFHAPELFRWASAGSLHNWYSSYGSEREESYIPQTAVWIKISC
jgi:hypothetical protein